MTSPQENQMKIIIVGCGKIGSTLAGKLNEVGNDVVVIDQNPVKVREVASRYDLMGIIGNGATRETLKEAGVDSAHLVIAVTGSDELNLLCCVMAKKNGCSAIARVKSPEYSGDSSYLKDELELAMVINPEYSAAEEIARLLKFPMAINIESFSKGKVDLIKYRLPEDSALVGLSMKDATVKFRAEVIVCTVERGEDAFIPKGDFVFAARDVISFAATQKNALSFLSKINQKRELIKSATVIGGGFTTHYLLGLLSRSGISVKVIEKNPDICEELSTSFDNVTVICGNPSDESVLIEEGATNSDAFIALTDLDEENILLSLFAKNGGSKKVITKINKIEYDSVISKLELDSIIYPKNIASDQIIRYARAKRKVIGSSMENLYNLIPGQVEAIEFTVGDRSALIGKPLLSLKIKENVLIASVMRGKQVIVPRGSTALEAGDSVLVVAKELSIHSLADLIKK